MSLERNPGIEARAKHGVFIANKWLIARRLSQLFFLLLFLSGPWWGLWIAKGTLSSSLTFDLLPLTDPLIALQSLLAGHWPEATAITGATIVLATYLVLGGRLYCSWVCPINPVSDLASWTRRKLGIERGVALKPQTRLYVLGAVLAAAVLTGTIAFELINPITTLHRSLQYGLTLGASSVILIFLYGVFVSREGWCGQLCPVGAFYGLLNRTALIRVSAQGRARCDDCMDCYAVCPELHVISPALKGAGGQVSPLILSPDCTACGRCIDVCPERIFRFTHRFDHYVEPLQESLTEDTDRSSVRAA